MPALPWRQFQPVEPGRQYAAMASRLPLGWERVRRRLASDTSSESSAGQ
jgi:hypothetical protein